MLLFLTGITYTLWGTNALSTIQLEAPEHLRGRAAALYFFAFLGGAPVGGLLCRLADRVGGTQLAFVAAGVIAIGTASGSSACAAPRQPRRGDRHGDRWPSHARLLVVTSVPRARHARPRGHVSSPIPRWVTKRTRRPSGAIASTPRSRAGSASARRGQHDVRLDLAGADQPRELAGAAVVVGEPLDEAERDETRRGERCPALWIVPPPSRRTWTRAASIVAASPASSAPNGAQRPLFRLSATVSTGAASAASGTPSATAAFGEPRAVEVDARAVPARRRASASVRATSSTVPPARVCVFSRQSSAAPERRARVDVAGSSRPRRRRRRGREPASSEIPSRLGGDTCADALATTAARRGARA